MDRNMETRLNSKQKPTDSKWTLFSSCGSLPAQSLAPRYVVHSLHV